MYWLMIRKHKKDEISSTWNTILIKGPKKTSALQEELYNQILSLQNRNSNFLPNS